MYVCVHKCERKCGDQRMTLGARTYLPPCLISLLFAPVYASETNRPVSLHGGCLFLYSCCRSVQLQCVLLHLTLQRSAELNSDSHIWIADTLLTQPFPQPKRNMFYSVIICELCKWWEIVHSGLKYGLLKPEVPKSNSWLWFSLSVSLEYFT